MRTLTTPAKINWFLQVLHRRADGFHEIRSLMQKIAIYDTLTFQRSDELLLQSDVPVKMEDNLVFKAADRLKKYSGFSRGASIKLEKNIPMGAGLGGGSSDAAAVLIGLNSFWELNLSIKELAGIGAEIGSDVPFFLYGALCDASGRGELISGRTVVGSCTILLVKPEYGISAAWAYGELAKKRRDTGVGIVEADIVPADHSVSKLTKKYTKDNNIEHFISSVENAQPVAMPGIVLNDLEPVVVSSFPEIAEIKEKMIQNGAVMSLMSGSGSTVFGVFDEWKAASKAADQFRECWTSVVRTITD
ncbi:MAG: 4-(cytidine 5'-diphospho)-2-C-methyl-D-erythritol kinase [Nitrospira sp.]|nr:4-(cytidine 5'-diphospho)-2-C-methyl-D-erythritol kinase [bacterium]MBL7048946.1 4-(cytidine 5'-diphospho)-2-C-methyl-D-erythritol kinase [Nitrospira sp.]